MENVSRRILVKYFVLKINAFLNPNEMRIKRKKYASTNKEKRRQ